MDEDLIDKESELMVRARLAFFCWLLLRYLSGLQTTKIIAAWASKRALLTRHNKSNSPSLQRSAYLRAGIN